jgi:hypothetical protein
MNESDLGKVPFFPTLFVTSDVGLTLAPPIEEVRLPWPYLDRKKYRDLSKGVFFDRFFLM